MKQFSYFSVLSVLILVFTSGCAENQTRIGEGIGIGSILGAAAGGIIGHQSGHGLQGALIGGAAGAATGGVVGAQIKKPSTADNAEEQVSSNEPLTMQDIVNLTKAGISSDEIITKIDAAKPKYSLTADDLNYLKNQGVSQRVIEAMQTAS